MVAHDEDHIGKGDRQRRLGQAARAQNRDDLDDPPAGDIPRRKPAAKLPHKGDEPLPRVRRPVAGQHRDNERVDRDRRGIVEQALALHQGRQPAGRADVVENPDDCNRVGGRDDRAENDAGEKPDRRNRPQGEPDDKGAHDHADHGEQQHRADFVAELAHIDIERRLEQERREEDVKQRFRAEAEIVQPSDNIADDAPGPVAGGQVGDAADCDPDERQHDGVRDRQPLGERQQQAHQPEQSGDGKDGLNGIGHDGRPGRAYRARRLVTRRTASRSYPGQTGRRQYRRRG